jgi:hypothetical protein
LGPVLAHSALSLSPLSPWGQFWSILQPPEIRNQKSEIRNLKSEIHSLAPLLLLVGGWWAPSRISSCLGVVVVVVVVGLLARFQISDF